MDTQFYTVLSQYYDELFPNRQPPADFIHSLLPGPSTILDAGCATGNLSISLARREHRVMGIDTDEHLLEQARHKTRPEGHNMMFRLLDMRKIGKVFGPGSYGCVACVGNTLPHLATAEEVRQFITDAHTILAPGGWLVLQLLNHDLIRHKGSLDLPVITTEHVIFKRQYVYDNGRILFHARLERTVEADVLADAITHVCLTPAVLGGLITGAGFTVTDRFAGPDRAAFTDDSQSLLVAARRA
ncbi:MAG: class I SAM-dependent methyltransferase [Planctomycetota bacterium]